MSEHNLAEKQRRQVFGVVLLLLAVVIFAIAMWGHVRRLSYASFALAAVGVWMLSRRGGE